jgi:acyl transferase domain-containing protein
MARQQTVFMFSGQGSPYYPMGRELFEGGATFRRWMLDLDALVRERIGQSVLSTLYDPARGKTDSFERLLLTHPAIFMIEVALAQALIARKVVPDYTFDGMV